MSRTIEAIVEKDGSLRLLEKVELRAGDRLVVNLHWGDADADEMALLSEPLLGEDWNRQEEDEARVGERASRWAALAFAVIVAVYAVGFFSASPSGDRLYFALWGAATAFLGTYISGMVSAVGAAFMIAAIYRREGAS